MSRKYSIWRRRAAVIAPVLIACTSALAPGGYEHRPGGTGHVVGRVVANERHCTVDGVCRLVLTAGGHRVTVIYGEGEAVPCVNQAAAEAGFRLEPGDHVEAYGRLQDGGGDPILTTCPGPDFYVRGRRP